MDATSRNESAGGSGAHGLGFLGELRFGWTFARLLGSILLEALVSVIHLICFLLGRKAQRARVRELILRPSATLAGSSATLPGSSTICILGLTLACAAGGLFSGCSAEGVQARSETRMSQPGASFGKQIDEMGVSAEALWNMDDAQESLESDLDAFSEDTSLEVAGKDAMEILTDPYGQKSLEDDFNAFSAPESGQLLETIELWGW